MNVDKLSNYFSVFVEVIDVGVLSLKAQSAVALLTGRHAVIGHVIRVIFGHRKIQLFKQVDWPKIHEPERFNKPWTSVVGVLSPCSCVKELNVG